MLSRKQIVVEIGGVAGGLKGCIKLLETFPGIEMHIVRRLDLDHESGCSRFRSTEPPFPSVARCTS